MKNVTFLIVSLVILAGGVAVTILQNSQEGSQMKKEPIQPLSSDMEKIVKQDFFNQHTNNVSEMTIDDVEIYVYYGTYSDCVVLDIGCRLLMRFTLAGYEIEGLFVPGLATAWKDGEFYNLRAAYDMGLLSINDISEIGRASKNISKP